MIKLGTEKRIRIIDIALIIYVITIFLYTDDLETVKYSQYAFYAFTAIFVVYAFVELKTVDISYMRILAPILIYSFLSIIIAQNSSLAFSRAQTILLLCIMSVMVYNTYNRYGNTNFLLIAILFGGLSVAANIISVYGLNGLMEGLSSGTRIGSEELQLNYLGRYTYLSAMISFYFANVRKKFRIPMYVVCIFSSLVCVASESRQAIFALAFALIFLYLSNDFSSSKIKLLIRIAVVLIAIYCILQISLLAELRERIFSGLSAFNDNSSSLSSDEKRVEMIRVGLNAFLMSPFFGNGFGNARYLMSGSLSGYRYLHNTYVELLATGGIFGFICYYLVYFIAFRKLLQCRRSGIWNSELSFIVILLIGQLMLEMFSVGYYSKVQYIIFTYVYLVIEQTMYGNVEEYDEL